MDSISCYNCIRKTECYTPVGLVKLSRGATFDEMNNGFECGACFRSYDEAREFIYIIGDVLRRQDIWVRKSIMKQIAYRVGVPLYNVEIEFER